MSSGRQDLPADRADIDAALDLCCERFLPGVAPTVDAAVRYALLGGGKRLRGTLFLAAYRAVGGDGEASWLAASIEIVHAYSLVHDDLPSMDNDDMRRGRPTVHRVFGLRAATAAGLTMVPLAARCAQEGAIRVGLSAGPAARIVEVLMGASGAGGMIAGQLLDLEGEARRLELAQLERVHRCKTGALIAAATTLGGMAGGGTPEHITALKGFGEAVGLAFQIADDILDVTESSETLGKTAGRDVVLGKSTYPVILGIAGASARAEELVRDGCAALRSQGLLTQPLDQLARFVVQRRS